MGEPIEKHSWNRELEFGLPDCRLRDPSRKMIMHGRMWMEKVFCANCGSDGGLVTPEFATHVFYLCEPCAEKHGKVEGAVEVSNEELARYGIEPPERGK